ncbi:GNAT family N-acetyltransferase [Terribacillus sp. 179-K 1B1 HS]|uniref:GNAT family N-acetyltransferase n=1 Tax=Terribacillus sp. 179-K 1B1 HS TaxID=3142388 RepID=UPI0039A1C917
MLWNIAVHPDHQRKGVAAMLLKKAVEKLQQYGITYLEAWTRDDDWICNWYKKEGFKQGAPYLQVFLENGEVTGSLKPPFKAIYTYAHYTGADIERQKQEHSRAHVCSRFVKEWT